MKNKMSQLNFLFFSTLAAILIWMASPNVKGNVKDTANPFPLREYKASYQVSWHGVDAGLSHHELTRRNSGEYHVETRTEPKLSMLPFHYVEASDFSFQNEKIVPLNYAYDIHEGKRRKKGLVTFNWANKTVQNPTLGEPWKADLTEGVQSKLTQTLCLRQALMTKQTVKHFTVAEEDKFKDYDFIIIGNEKITTKLGVFETLKMEHRSRRGNRTTLWLAKEFDYVPVKMMQYRNGKVAATGEIIAYHPK